MDRLTARSNQGLAYLVNVKPDEQVVESQYPNTLRCIMEAFKRLAAYEDTGLTPEDIDNLRADNAAMQQEWQDAHDELKCLRADLARVTAERDAAVAEMKRIVDAVREEHCDETCCFACKYDCDTSITDTGDYACECPGFERDDCFEWRGVQQEEAAQ